MSNDAPVDEGEHVDVVIEAVGDKGDGIAKVEGFVLFVSGTEIGDKVKVRVTKVLENVGFAEVVEQQTKQKKKKNVIEKDEDGREKIIGENLEAEYDPSKDSESFGE
jgi:predicted RNA-binding protein with TRAM domain